MEFVRKTKLTDILPVFKIIFCIDTAALITTILGFAVPLWNSFVTPFSPKIDHLGLWQACFTNYGCIALPSSSNLPGFIIATRLFMSLGLIGSLLSSVGTVLFIWVERLQRNIKFRVLILVITMSTALSIVIALSVWGSYARLFLSFAFAMSCIAAILHTCKALLLTWYYCSIP